MILERSRIEHCLINLLQRNDEVVRKCMSLYVRWLYRAVIQKQISVDSVGAFILEKQILKGVSVMGKSQPFQQNLCRTGFYREYEENSPKPLPNISTLKTGKHLLAISFPFSFIYRKGF